jgi:hypothetical protein|tara:strand:- start:442 stop:570 length:129 start_codon:yes stop_codon:yes gene_type:complete
MEKDKYMKRILKKEQNSLIGTLMRFPSEMSMLQSSLKGGKNE